MFVAESDESAAKAAPATTPVPPPTWKQIIRPVEPFLQAVSDGLASQVTAFEPEIAEFARYALATQGKQLRPALVCLSGSAIAPPNEDLVTVAVIIEMVHLATLVHDDVMDEATVRRRRPTMAANWGNQISVLVGDCLFAHALHLAARFPTPEICRAVSAATNTVCSGEILQTLARGNLNLQRQEYFRMLEMKTAELFALSCELGAALNQAPTEQRNALRHYGMNLGTAYQVYDDCVDLFGSERSAGKSLGTDLHAGKLTLPMLVVRERATGDDSADLNSILQSRKIEQIGALTDLCEKYEALPECKNVIHGFLRRASDSLAILPASAGRESLERLCLFMAQQTDALGVYCR